MARKIRRKRYIVQSSGQFLIDMLRYDCAWPARETDSY